MGGWSTFDRFGRAASRGGYIRLVYGFEGHQSAVGGDDKAVCVVGAIDRMHGRLELSVEEFIKVSV